jgi:hypothetical protein
MNVDMAPAVAGSSLWKRVRQVALKRRQCRRLSVGQLLTGDGDNLWFLIRRMAWFSVSMLRSKLIKEIDSITSREWSR